VTGFDLITVSESAIQVAESLEDAVANAAVVLSLNSSSAALRAAERTAPHLAAGAIFADANTTTPALKRKLAELFAPEAFVDVAMMSVATPATATAMTPTDGPADEPAEAATVLAMSGPAAQTLLERLTPLKLNTEFVSTEVGQAAARNLARSMLAKGLAGVVVDYMWAAEALGLADWAYDDMLREFDGMDRSTAMGYLKETVKNAKRREIEMLDIVEMLEEADYHSLFVPPTQLVPQELHGKPPLPGVQPRAVHQQAGRLMNSYQRLVLVEHREVRRGFGRDFCLGQVRRRGQPALRLRVFFRSHLHS
jgi:3-hydroxyisobutyrate dehydrogenase-like beta-hydroxyacid dehydrogenase